MSVFQVPGIMTNPFPNGSIDQADRQQISDIVYAGILANVPLGPPNTTTWTRQGRKSNSWVNQSRKASTWIKEGLTSGTWTEEDEVRATN